MALIDINDCTLEVLHLAALEGKAGFAPRAPHTLRLVLPGCGHSAHRDAAEAVSAAIAAFLAPIA
jgi:pimeloyl-ACP methyl ester carboxylesterase